MIFTSANRKSSFRPSMALPVVERSTAPTIPALVYMLPARHLTVCPRMADETGCRIGSDGQGACPRSRNAH